MQFKLSSGKRTDEQAGKIIFWIKYLFYINSINHYGSLSACRDHRARYLMKSVFITIK